MWVPGYRTGDIDRLYGSQLDGRRFSHDEIGQRPLIVQREARTIRQDQTLKSSLNNWGIMNLGTKAAELVTGQKRLAAIHHDPLMDTK